jgi:hypothetical protein
MKIYHRTNHAREIFADGFVDGQGTYLTENIHTGVWFSDVPLDDNEGASGDTVLSLDIPEQVLAEYEWAEEGKGYREFLLPASVANHYGPLTTVDDVDSVIKQWQKN